MKVIVVTRVYSSDMESCGFLSPEYASHSYVTHRQMSPYSTQHPHRTPQLFFSQKKKRKQNAVKTRKRENKRTKRKKDRKERNKKKKKRINDEEIDVDAENDWDLELTVENYL
ncbi:hypothetical protein RIR_jg39406.t1 [Rhizophagus irregularis DAOM 181602=DAOM 197198]|nr:hypothetical protein RIR_jg39406.t1 [Rhizophagus irregularis DAOM 181602=DAOM 197198]